ncbi:MAG: N-acetylmuramoyl-L-alanine amidase [Thermodesulfobacteriota bacterium]
MVRSIAYPALAALFFLLPAKNAYPFAIGTGEYIPQSPLKVIVLDPGHGGTDSGAIGPTGVMEKDITLSIAKNLERELSKTINSLVILTRNDDTYISLKERTNIANRHEADLFLSIHVNAALRAGANGVETFFLSLKASDNNAEATAERENSVASSGTHPEDGSGSEEEIHVDPLQSILMDLDQTATHHKSSRLAELIHESASAASNGENRGVKQALFMVLAGAAMPAALVEVGFISNPEEEEKLSQEDTRKLMATALLKGVMGFEREFKKDAAYGAPRKNLTTTSELKQ